MTLNPSGSRPAGPRILLCALALCLLALAAAASDSRSPGEQVAKACPDIDVAAETSAWGRVPPKAAKDWLATGSIGERSVSEARVKMWFIGAVLVEEITVDEALVYRSLTGIKDSKTVTIWTDVAKGSCRKVVGRFAAEDEAAARVMDRVELEYRSDPASRGCFDSGQYCGGDDQCCSDDCSHNVCA